VEKMVNCSYWKEYRGINGWIMFCSAGAFAKEFNQEYAEKLGCTAEQRTICNKTMKINMGYGLVPKILDDKKKKEDPADAVTAPGKPA
jgi:hypothetical protein